MQLKFSYLLLLLLLLGTCDRNPINGGKDTIPEIVSLQFNYSQFNRTLFIAAEVSDPQGYEDIDSVVFRLIRLPEAGAEEGTLTFQGRLYDDGTRGDIIIRDFVFSYLITADLLVGEEGYYRLEVQAYDHQGNCSQLAIKNGLVAQNSAPTLFLLEAPRSFEKGDTLKFRLRVMDQQGYNDLATVAYSVRQPTGNLVSHPTFALRDDGLFGDDVARDGIFTVRQPSNKKSRLQGLFTFHFFARDIHGAVSDTLKVDVRNPGVTVTYPDSVASIQAGSSVTITWESAYIDQVKIEYTTNADLTSPTYTLIATLPAAVGRYNWTVPNESQEHCRIRISDTTNPNRNDSSDLEFKIQP